jgi:ribosomal protein S18 acetylase RimI-like enzyme
LNTVTYEVNPALEDTALNTLRARAEGLEADRSYARVLARSLVFVGAFMGARLIGFVNVATDGGLHAFLLDPTVDPEFQRQGIGTRLVQLAAEESRARGCEWLHVDFEPQLTPFYSAVGFQTTVAGVMHLDRTG